MSPLAAAPADRAQSNLRTRASDGSRSKGFGGRWRMRPDNSFICSTQRRPNGIASTSAQSPVPSRNHVQPKADEVCPGIPRPRAGWEDIAAPAESDPQRIGPSGAGPAADVIRRRPNSIKSTRPLANFEINSCVRQSLCGVRADVASSRLMPWIPPSFDRKRHITLSSRPRTTWA
jgi:hypothetical protein